MTYLLLSLAFLAVAAVIALLAYRAAARRATALAGMSQPADPRPVVLGAIALFMLTAVFDNLMIASGLFAYSDAHISGVRLGLAPVEDFSYPLAAVVLLPALWTLFGGARAR